MHTRPSPCKFRVQAWRGQPTPRHHRTVGSRGLSHQTPGANAQAILTPGLALTRATFHLTL